MPKIIAITSGKGGVGKTNISVNLAIQLARQNHKVCLFDADLGLANINILLGLAPDHTLEDVINGDKTIRDILIKDENGIDIIPGSSGVGVLLELDETRLGSLVKPLSELEEYDYVFFDTSAGISRNVIAFCMASTEIILTVVPEPTSFTDSYSLLKVLYQNGFRNQVSVVINRCKNTRLAQKVFIKFKETVNRYIDMELHYLGSVVEDSQVTDAVTGQRPFIDMFPDSKASSCINDLALQLLTKTQENNTISMEDFWTSFIHLIKSPISVDGSVKKKISPKKSSNTPEKESLVSPTASVEIKQTELIHQVIQALNTLVKNTDDIHTELGALRKIVETGNTELSKINHVEESPSRNDPPTIMLDFDKFLKKRKSGTQEAEADR